MNANIFGIILSSAAVVMLGGCARNISSETYKASHIGEASMSYQGVIVSARGVTVDESEYLEGNQTGIGLGALGGGVIGNQFGRGGGNLAATVGGALLGGTAGAFAERELKRQNAMEYVVRLNNGSMMTVVQGPEPALSTNQRVMVLVSQQGRSRIIADNSAYNEAQPLIIQQSQPATVVPPQQPAPYYNPTGFMPQMGINMGSQKGSHNHHTTSQTHNQQQMNINNFPGGHTTSMNQRINHSSSSSSSSKKTSFGGGFRFPGGRN